MAINQLFKTKVAIKSSKLLPRVGKKQTSLTPRGNLFFSNCQSYFASFLPNFNLWICQINIPTLQHIIFIACKLCKYHVNILVISCSTCKNEEKECIWVNYVNTSVLRGLTFFRSLYIFLPNPNFKIV